MCERMFTGCPHCEVPAEDNIFERALQTELIKYHVDENGDRNYDIEPDYDGDYEYRDDGYECSNCGWTGGELAEVSLEDCDCDECVEPEPSEEGPDPNRLVSLRRHGDHIKPTVLAADWPKELIQLANDRTIDHLPMPRWRACEIFNEHLGGTAFYVDFDTPDPQIIADLMHDYSDQPELPKEANDEHVAACA